MITSNMEHLEHNYIHFRIENQSQIHGLGWFPSSLDTQTFTISSSSDIQQYTQSVEYLEMYFWFEYDDAHTFLDVCNGKITDLAYNAFGYILEWIPSKKMQFDYMYGYNYMFSTAFTICGTFTQLCLDYLERFLYSDLGIDIQ